MDDQFEQPRLWRHSKRRMLWADHEPGQRKDKQRMKGENQQDAGRAVGPTVGRSFHHPIRGQCQGIVAEGPGLVKVAGTGPKAFGARAKEFPLCASRGH